MMIISHWSMDCNHAEKYLMLLVKMKTVPDKLKKAILKSLDTIGDMEGYAEYQFYNIVRFQKNFVSEAHFDRHHIEIADHLNKMRRLSGGEEFVNHLVQDLFNIYPTRRAMKMIFAKYLKMDIDIK